MACLAERLADKASSSSQYARVLMADKPLLATTTGPGGPTGCCWAFGGYSLNEVGKTQDGWQLLSMAIDSGAAETVIPHRLISQALLRIQTRLAAGCATPVRLASRSRTRASNVSFYSQWR